MRLKFNKETAGTIAAVLVGGSWVGAIILATEVPAMEVARFEKRTHSSASEMGTKVLEVAERTSECGVDRGYDYISLTLPDDRRIVLRNSSVVGAGRVVEMIGSYEAPVSAKIREGGVAYTNDQGHIVSSEVKVVDAWNLTEGVVTKGTDEGSSSVVSGAENVIQNGLNDC